MERDRTIEARIDEMEAVHDIMNLEAELAFAADNGQPDRYAELFTEDAVLDLRPNGELLKGREAIRRFRQESPKRVTFSVHYLSNPHIVVNGDTATGRLNWLAALTKADTNQGVWSSGYYLDQFAKTADGWRIKRRTMTWYYRTPYDKGWARERIGAPQRPNKQ